MQHRELARFIADTLSIDPTEPDGSYVDSAHLNDTIIDGSFNLYALAQAILTRYPPKEPT